jgi:hypothetical protein
MITARCIKNGTRYSKRIPGSVLTIDVIGTRTHLRRRSLQTGRFMRAIGSNVDWGSRSAAMAYVNGRLGLHVRGIQI